MNSTLLVLTPKPQDGLLDKTSSCNLFHSTGVVVENPCLPIEELIEGTDSLFPQNRLLDVSKRWQYGVWGKVMVLKVRRLY